MNHTSTSYLTADGKCLEGTGRRRRPSAVLNGRHVVVVEVALDGRGAEEEYVLKLRGECRLENFVTPPQDEPLEKGVEDVGTEAHQTNILPMKSQEKF